MLGVQSICTVNYKCELGLCNIREIEAHGDPRLLIHFVGQTKSCMGICNNLDIAAHGDPRLLIYFRRGTARVWAYFLGFVMSHRMAILARSFKCCACTQYGIKQSVLSLYPCYLDYISQCTRSKKAPSKW